MRPPFPWTNTALLPLLLWASAALPQTRGARGAPPADTLASLAAGSESTCVTSTSGAAWCWGSHIGTHEGVVQRMLDPSGQPARLRSLQPSWFDAFCGMGSDGRVWCGPAVVGALNSAGVWVNHPEACGYRVCVGRVDPPGELSTQPVRSAVAGSDHSCALALSGRVFCWGHNHMGQLGNGGWAADSTGSTGAAVPDPAPVAGGHLFSEISAGESLTCGLTRGDGFIYCWGYGQSGSTGDTAVMHSCSSPRPFPNRDCSSAVPHRVLPDSIDNDWLTRPSQRRFVSVRVGMRMACAVSEQGEAWCWGSNYRCGLGVCRSPDSPRAHRVAVPGRVVEVGAGYWFACARTADGRLFCWGDNTAGQLGSLVSVNAGADGGPPDYRDRSSHGAAWNDPCFTGGRCSPAAAPVAPNRRWAALAVGTSHACALSADDGGVYCWGGTHAAALGPNAHLVNCVNRSATWQDTRCQPEPVRVPGLPPLAAPLQAPEVAPAEAAHKRDHAAAGTRVIATREQVRVIFAADTADAWGWPASEGNGSAREYEWSISVNGLEGARTVLLTVPQRDSAERTFPTLQALVATGETLLCPPGPFVTCSTDGIRAEVEGRNVVLVIQDTGLVRRLFALRPSFVRVWRNSPDLLPSYALDSAQVEYASPQIPPPTAEMIADGRLALRRQLAAKTSITRRIATSGSDWGELWIQDGDSVQLRLQEDRCDYDVCTGGDLPAPDAHWSVDDSAVVRLRVAADTGSRRRLSWPPARTLVARRPGRTTLRVTGVHDASDTIASRRPVAANLERTVVVTRRIARVSIEPMPATARVNETRRLEVRVYDVQGGLVPGAPATLHVSGGRYPYQVSVGVRSAVLFDAPGAWTIVAEFAGRADTVRVMVQDTGNVSSRESFGGGRDAAAPQPSRSAEARRERRPGSAIANVGGTAPARTPPERHPARAPISLNGSLAPRPRLIAVLGL
jgi:hypothetical protein